MDTEVRNTKREVNAYLGGLHFVRSRNFESGDVASLIALSVDRTVSVIPLAKLRFLLMHLTSQ